MRANVTAKTAELTYGIDTCWDLRQFYETEAPQPQLSSLNVTPLSFAFIRANSRALTFHESPVIEA